MIIENLETKTRYETLRILKDETEEYIKTFTFNHRYIGELKYLLAYKFLVNVLENKEAN